MKALVFLLLPTVLLLLAQVTTPAQDPDEDPFANFGGTDAFPADSGTVPLTNTRVADPNDDFAGSDLSTGSSSLPTGGSPSSVPEAGFARPPAVGGGAPSSVPSGF